MSRQVLELEAVLQQLVGEHERLLGHLDAHQEAMRKLDLRRMDEEGKAQEASRLRIATIENRRRQLAQQLGLMLRIEAPVTITKLAEALPQMRDRLLSLGNAIKAVVGEIERRVTVGSRLAGAIMGHLNTVVRLVAGVVEQAGLYTRDGVPKVSGRIGVMEAVG